MIQKHIFIVKIVCKKNPEMIELLVQAAEIFILDEKY